MGTAVKSVVQATAHGVRIPPSSGLSKKSSLVGTDHRRHSGNQCRPRREGLPGIHFDFSPAGRPRPCCRATSGCGIERIRLSFLCSVLFLPSREQRRPNEEEKRQRRKWIPSNPPALVGSDTGMTAKTENRAQAQVLFPPRWGFSTTPCQGGKGHVPDEGGDPEHRIVHRRDRPPCLS